MKRSECNLNYLKVRNITPKGECSTLEEVLHAIHTWPGKVTLKLNPRFKITGFASHLEEHTSDVYIGDKVVALHTFIAGRGNTAWQRARNMCLSEWD